MTTSTEPAHERSTHELIAALSQDLSPVRRIPALRAAVAGVVGVGGATALAWLALGPGMRSHAAIAGAFVAVLAGLLLVAAGATLAALAGAVPGREAPARAGGLVALAGLGVACGLGALLSTWGAEAGGAAALIRCELRALALAVPAAAVCAWFVHRGAVGRPLVVAGAGIAGAVGLGAAVTHLACPLSDGAHVIPGHAAAPLLWLALLAPPAARLLRAVG